MSRRLVLACLLALATALPVQAALTSDELLDDPVLEARARAIGKELRCLVCQNQSIDDSDADLARDLRHLVRERLLAGDSDAEIRQFMVDRYGAFVLLEPPLTTGTLLLWGGPFLVLAVGAVLLAVNLRRRRAATTQALTPDEERRLAELLDEGAGRP
ncbi:MAG: cytochrome c-type biogenesis protein [Geminicoccaceae bacterium]